MRSLFRAVLLLVLLFAAAAQRRGFAPMPRPMPPAGTSPPVATPPIATPPIASPPITTPPGANFGAWRRREGPPRSQPEQPSVVVMPYATPYPVYVDSQAQTPEGEDPQQYPPSPLPPAELPPRPIPTALPPPIAGAPNAEPAPAPCGGVPNPAPALPTARPVPKDDPPSFFIAMQDGWVYVARAYWVDKDTLHYITENGRHNQVSLALVNRGVSTRLNAKRADEFRLPPPE
jgi:hypothetical protein